VGGIICLRQIILGSFGGAKTPRRGVSGSHRRGVAPRRVERRGDFPFFMFLFSAMNGVPALDSAGFIFHTFYNENPVFFFCGLLSVDGWAHGGVRVSGR